MPPTLRALVLAALLGARPLLAQDTPPPPLSPFGFGSCYTNNRSAQDNVRWIPQMAAIGLHSFRACDASWGTLEPDPGVWRWDTLDEQVAYLKAQHLEFGAILIGTPKWSQLDRPGTLPVHNLEGWSSYVTALVGHLKGNVSYFEVWNEPPNFTGRDQTPADYAKIVVAAYDAAKAANPHCLIGLAAKSAHVNYLEQVIKAGAKDHFDYITVHPYEVLNGIADNAGTEAVFMHIVPVIRTMLAAQDPAKADVPVLFTELGCDAGPAGHGAGRGPLVQAQTLVKAYTMGLAQGVACLHWFEGMDGDSGPMGLLERDGTPRPSYTALAQMIEHLGQHPAYVGWVLLENRDYGFVFQGAKGPVLSTWARAGAPHRLEFGQDVSILDPLTGHAVTARTYDLTSAPILVLDPPSPLIAQAKANLLKPFPWDGDYTGAPSVSLTFGQDTVARGLHTRSGDAVAQAVVAYGGSARAGNVPGGSVFIVDPNFLSYTSTPIEITATVRRNEANDNAGFKLVYESPEGFKTAGGWYTVPDNKEWHTVTWKIADPQFVNYWGYNFALESDGNQYNKYYLQSVTVTKLPK